MRSVWLVVLLIGFAAGAQAQSFETNMNRCWNESADPDRQLSACTWLLNSGLLGPSEYPTTHLQRGNVYFSKRQYGRAIQDYGQAIALKPDFAAAYHNRSFTYSTMGQFDQAILDYDEAITRSPDFARAHNSKAWLLATSRRADLRDGHEAVRLAQRAVEIDDKADYIDTLAAAYAEAGWFADSMRAQERAIGMLRAAGLNGEISDYQSRLDLYRAGRPHRE